MTAEDPFPSRLARGGYQPPPGGKPLTNPPTGGSNVTPPQGMSAEERVLKFVRSGSTDWTRMIPMVEEADAAARADERVKAWNEALMTLSKKECLGCGAGEIPVWIVIRPSLPKYLRHPTGGLGSQPCTASDIQAHRLPEAQPGKTSKTEDDGAGSVS